MQIQLPKQASPPEIDVPCGFDQLHSVEDSSVNISSNEGFSSVPTAIASDEESAPTQLEQSSSECCDIRSDRSEHSDFSFMQDMASSVASHSAAPSQTTTEFWDEEKESLVSEPCEPNGQLSPRSGTSFGQLHGLGRTVIGAAVDSSVSLASRFLPIPSRFLPSMSPRSETTHEEVPPPFTLQMNSVDLSAFSASEPLENETNDGLTATLVGDEPSSQLDEFLQRIRSTEEMIRGRVQILRSHESDEEKSTPLEMDPSWLHDDRDNLRAEIRGLISQTLDITHIFPNFSGRLRQLNFSDDDEGMLSSLVDRSVAVFEHVSHELFPFFQEFVVETWDFFRDVLEYYDPNPKYNVFLRTIDKVNEIFAAIQSLYSLSECYFNELDSLEGLEIDYVSSVPPLPMLETQPSQQEQDGELQNDTETMSLEESEKEEEGTTDERENESISRRYDKDHNNDTQHTDEHQNALISNSEVSVGT